MSEFNIQSSKVEQLNDSGNNYKLVSKDGNNAVSEKGNIVQKVVVQSLAPAIDTKVLEALENWRFRPATRNGIAIASKQDVYYHFPRLGKG